MRSSREYARRNGEWSPSFRVVGCSVGRSVTSDAYRAGGRPATYPAQTCPTFAAPSPGVLERHGEPSAGVRGQRSGGEP